MSISSAFANALTGLSAASKRTEIISGNVANALTEGYARRSIVASASVLAGQGGGVRVEGVQRATDPRVTADRRVAEAGLGAASTLSEAEARVSQAYGAAGDDASLPMRSAAFEVALRDLSGSPESSALQRELLDAATRLVDGVRGVSAAIDALRMDADAAISREIDTLNSTLAEVQDLNAEIRKANALSAPTAALEQQRQDAVDAIASIVPVRSILREGGAIALYTTNGAALLDGTARPLEFTPTGTITADMTLAGGALSGVTIDGRQLSVGRADEGGVLDGGSLGAHFRTRDDLGVAAHAQIDGFAQDLASRFEDPAADPTQTPGAAGLFTDAGSALDPSDTIGLAGRLQVNAAVDPDRGGELYRLRDGLYATASGEEGEDDILKALLGNFAELRAAPAETRVNVRTGAVDLAGRISALRGQSAGSAELAASTRRGRYERLTQEESGATGVNTDDELSNLILVEEAYSANAKVLQVVDSLMKRLLEI